ncbi:MAG TPA: hypothetical protein VIQ31_24795 [Phormidium sp.]
MKLPAFFRVCVVGVMALLLLVPTSARAQALGNCSWGEPAISQCLRGTEGLYCHEGYACDPIAGKDGRGRCCARNTLSPKCNSVNPCPTGYTCVENQCQLLSSLKCSNGSVPTGLCVNNQCPQWTSSSNYVPQTCDASRNLCCPK